MSEQHPPATTPSPEAAPEPGLVDATIDAAATSQVRLLALGAMARDPSHPWTTPAVCNEINRMQGGDPEWHLPKSANGMIHRYSEAFEQLGLVRIETDEAGRRIMYANEEAASTTLAVIGTLVSWQARNPDIPLQYVFGSNYRESPGGKRGHSSLRLAIIEHVERGISSHKQIAEALDEPSSRVDAAVRELAANDILHVVSRTDRDARTVRIDPAILDVDPSTRRAAPGSAAREIWETARALAARGVTSVTGSEFLEKIAPGADPDRVWAHLVKYLPEQRVTHMSFEPFARGGAYAQISVNPSRARALAELGGRLKILRSGSTYIIEDAKDRALALMDSEWAMARVMGVAYDESGGARRPGRRQDAEDGMALKRHLTTFIFELPDVELAVAHSNYVRGLQCLEAAWAETTNEDAQGALELLRGALDRLTQATGSLVLTSLQLREYRDQL